jgi:hypothetical protein
VQGRDRNLFLSGDRPSMKQPCPLAVSRRATWVKSPGTRFPTCSSRS